LSTYKEVYEKYLNELQKLANTLTHSSENIKLFEIAEKMKTTKLIENYKLLDNGLTYPKSLYLQRYPDEHYNKIFEE